MVRVVMLPPQRLWKMTRSLSRDAWQAMSQAEKAIYGATSIDGFFSLCCVYITRYHEQPFAAKNAFRGVLGAIEKIPTQAESTAGLQRVMLFKTLRDYAALRDRGFDRAGAVQMLIGSEEDPENE